MASLQPYSSGGRKYWRIVESYREDGRPKVRVLKHIGTVDNLLSMLEGRERSIRVRSTSHGDVACLLQMAQELGVARSVDKALTAFFPQGIPTLRGLTPGQTCVLIAIGRACHPTSKMGWAGWARDTSLPGLLDLSLDGITSQFFWDQMDHIPVSVLAEVEEELGAQALSIQHESLDLLLYDTTNFFTFIASTNGRSKLAQRGKNKQKRYDLRQFGLALLVSREGQLPLWHQLYRGDRPDVSIFPDVLTRLRERMTALASDITELTLVCDRGNNASKKNQTKLDASGFHYVAALTPSNHLDLIAQANSALTSVALRADETIQAYRTKQEIWGAERTVVVFISKLLREGQIRGLHQHLTKKLQRFEEFALKLRNPRAKRRTRDDIEQQAERLLSGQYMKRVLRPEYEEVEPGRFRLDCFVDGEAYDGLVNQHFGRRILITDRHDWTTAEIIETYRGQAKIEKVFEVLKDPFHLAVRPQYHWTDQKIEVHTFCCLVGYLLARMIHHRVLERTSFRGSLRTMMDLLAQIRLATVLEMTPGQAGRPRLRTMLDHPDEPRFGEIIDALAISS